MINEAEISVTEMEARMAVLHFTYHNTRNKFAFLEKIAAETSTITPAEAGIAWELIDYQEWQNDD